jgi:hypothetical protein
VRLVRSTVHAMWELRRARYDGALLIDDPDTVPVAVGARGRKRVLDEFGWERVGERVEAAVLEIPGVSG